MSRRRSLFRLTVWTFAGTLLLKSAVPMFASLAAHLQGRGVAEVCAIYGVALPGARSAPVQARAALELVAAADDAHHGHAHAGHAIHGHDGHAMPADHVVAAAQLGHASHGVHASTAGHDVASHGSGESVPTHDGGGHGTDHCVLTALATFAAGTAVATPLPVAPARVLHHAASRQPLLAVDASARWAALLGHGPPRLS